MLIDHSSHDSASAPLARLGYVEQILAETEAGTLEMIKQVPTGPVPDTTCGRCFSILRREAGCEEVILSMDGSWCPAIDTDEADRQGAAEGKKHRMLGPVIAFIWTISKRGTFASCLLDFHGAPYKNCSTCREVCRLLLQSSRLRFSVPL